MDFSILIATMHSRNSFFQEVLAEVQRQISELPSNVRAEVLYEVDGGEMTLGAKRNLLVSRACGKYHCFIDDDDVISPTFIKSFIPMLEDDYDCASYVGMYYYRGDSNKHFEKPFYHSVDVTEWYETPGIYYRNVTPMNMVRTDIVRQVQYKDIRNTEDHEFATRLADSGLLKKEYKIPFTPIYHYIDGVKETRYKWRHEWTDDLSKLRWFIPDFTPTLPGLRNIKLSSGFFKRI
jgi:glycosyltransferase involved in cell wall biosynthesis